MNITLCRPMPDKDKPENGFFACESETDSYRVPFGLSKDLIAMPLEDFTRLILK